MGKVFFEIEDKQGFLERYAQRMEELGDYYGSYPMVLENPYRVNAIVHGLKRPRMSELEEMAKNLEVSVTWLLYGVGEPSHPGQSE